MNVKSIIKPLIYVSAIVGSSVGVIKYANSQQAKYDRAPVKDEFVLSSTELKSNEQKVEKRRIHWDDAAKLFSKYDDNRSGFTIPKKGMVPYEEVDNAFVFTTRMAIDADGSPNAYTFMVKPKYQEAALDVFNSAFNEVTGELDGIAHDSLGNLYHGGGFGCYVSQTSLADETKPDYEQSKYVNAETVPYFVLPTGGFNGAEIGDLGIIYNNVTGKYTCAVFADEGPMGYLGEGSIAAAKAIGVNPNAKVLSQFDNITYLVFPKSGGGSDRIPSNDEINEKGEKLFQVWGGLDRLKNLSTELSTQAQTKAYTPEETSKVAIKYMNNLRKDFGLTKPQAAGIVANLMHESEGMNPGINQGGAIGEPSSNMADDNENGYGIAQWGGVRKKSLINYAKGHGIPVSSDAANYGYLRQELKGDCEYVIDIIKNTNSVEESTKVFEQIFERATDPQMNSRLAFAYSLMGM